MSFRYVRSLFRRVRPLSLASINAGVTKHLNQLGEFKQQEEDRKQKIADEIAALRKESVACSSGLYLAEQQAKALTTYLTAGGKISE